ncbi:MAG: Methyltransferase type 11 [uncultured bacterium]|nr:MAG: Methyltransferase type 11 [uncultured bacterium]HBR79244.1 hypothetical protein [Candidatus Moranbacteria bacterium]HCU01351.1 hypothetical protein [Candidatus Nomurabacteria bacterium]
MTKKTIFISAVNDFDIYRQCVVENKYVKDNNAIKTVCLDNSKENKFISKRYNEFISSYDFSSEVWFVFCHSDWEIMEDIAPKLESLDKNCLYGPIGAIIIKNNHGIVTSEGRGRIYDRKRDGSNLRLMECYSIKNGIAVDTFDCQCLIVHSSLIKKNNLRFDEQLEFDMYVEDFCMNAMVSRGIESRILKLECCHRQQLDDINERPNFFDKLNYINNKYHNHLFGTTILPLGGNGGKKIKKIIHAPVLLEVIKDRSMIYQWDINLNNIYDARVIALNYIEKGSTVLDVGCACGDFGKALKREKDCIIYGMEYDNESIAVAKKTESFEDIYQLDLNNFNIDDYSNLEKKINYIVFGDVLEHVINPQKVLNAFKKLLKDDGYFIISLPNVAHASIKASLLNDEFEYGDIGLLDQTHLRFFTYKSLASLFSNIYLKIDDVKFVPLDMHGFFSKDYYANLSNVIKNHIFSSPHSFVCQYVMKISASEESRLKIYKKNTIQLGMAGDSAPKHIKDVMENRKNELVRIDLSKLSRFRKLKNGLIYLENGIKFILFSPNKFIKKYFKI